MVQRNTPVFSLNKIFEKLGKKLPDVDPKSFEGVTDDRELTIVLLDLLSSDELRAEMKPLILEIIRNEGLNKEIKVNEVFERAVALYNAKERKTRDHVVDTDTFLKNVLPYEPKTALDMIQVAESTFPLVIKNYIKTVLQEFAFDSTPAHRQGILQPEMEQA